MKSRLTFAGVGPRLALITLPYLALVLFIRLKQGELLKLDFLSNAVCNIIGYSLITVGLIFYLATIIVFLKDFPKGKLVTRGPFRLCRNPIYGSFIIFFIPGIAFLMQSGLFLTVDLVLYLNFRMAIHGEYIALRENFGKEFEYYQQSVREIVPIPKFKKANSNF